MGTNLAVLALKEEPRLKHMLAQKGGGNSVDDVFGEALLKLFKYKGEVEYPSAFISQVVRSALTDHFRKKSSGERPTEISEKNTPIFHSDNSPADFDEDNFAKMRFGETYRDLAAAGVKDAPTKIIFGMYSNGVPFELIAKLLGRSVPAVKSALYRERESLQERMDKDPKNFLKRTETNIPVKLDLKFLQALHLFGGTEELALDGNSGRYKENIASTRVAITKQFAARFCDLDNIDLPAVVEATLGVCRVSALYFLAAGNRIRPYYLEERCAGWKLLYPEDAQIIELYFKAFRSQIAEARLESPDNEAALKRRAQQALQIRILCYVLQNQKGINHDIRSLAHVGADFFGLTPQQLEPRLRQNYFLNEKSSQSVCTSALMAEEVFVPIAGKLTPEIFFEGAAWHLRHEPHSEICLPSFRKLLMQALVFSYDRTSVDPDAGSLREVALLSNFFDYEGVNLERLLQVTNGKDHLTYTEALLFSEAFSNVGLPANSAWVFTRFGSAWLEGSVLANCRCAFYQGVQKHGGRFPSIDRNFVIRLRKGLGLSISEIQTILPLVQRETTMSEEELVFALKMRPKPAEYNKSLEDIG